MEQGKSESISLDPNLRYLEENMLDAWRRDGTNPSLAQMLKQMHARLRNAAG